MAQYARTPPRSSSRTCLILSLVGVILICCCLAAAGGGGYYLYSSGRISLNDVLKVVNLGPAEIQLTNLSDGTIEAELRAYSDSGGETNSVDSASIASYEMAAFRSISAGSYELIIDVPNGIPPGDTCTMHVNGGDTYHILVIPEGILIVLEGKEAINADGANMAKSPLCGR